MRRLALVALLLLGGQASGQGVPTPKAVNPLEFREVLAGWWDEGPDREMRQFCGPDRNLHRHVFSDDGKTVTWEFERPTKMYDDKEVKSYTYRIVGASSVVLTLLFDGETRKNDKGELAVWELVIVDYGLFRWRATDFPTGVYNPVWGRRCR
jgi:hypothetical protein